MNPNHLRATLWLRWRILVNRVRRTSKLNNVLFGGVLVLAALACLSLFVLALMLGLEKLPEAEPLPLMLVWIALAGGFLFSWMIGLLTDLQRSDAMSFKNLLHLPVSLRWIFLYNYLSSFVSLSVAIFLPAMLGLWLAMWIVSGPSMLLTLPLVLGFFGMITAITYQFRGWLARIMEDKRRGRNIIAVITVGFVIVLQAPNLLNLMGSSDRREKRRVDAEHHAEGSNESLAAHELLHEENVREDAALERKITLGAQVIPLGWLPYGMRTTFEGRWLPGVFCTLGLWAICTWSLLRSYRKTLASIVGAGGGVVVASPVREASSVASGERKTLMVQRTLPFIGDREAGIAYACLRSLLRAPEIKMLLLSPVILLGIFGVMLSNNAYRGTLSSFAPMMSLGAIALGLLSIIQLLQNQFGLDREGFRAFVMSPVPRHQILVGKNLATAPLGIGVSLIALIVLQVLVPVDLAHFLGGILQLFSAYLLLCMVGNMTSIVGPVRLKENGLKAANAQWKTILWQLLSLLLVPTALSPLLIPGVVELLLSGQGWARALPLYPLMHAAGLIAITLGYRGMLRSQGRLLQAREQRILDVLTHD